MFKSHNRIAAEIKKSNPNKRKKTLFIPVFFQLILFSVLTSANLYSAPQSVRWTATEDKVSDFDHIVQVINSKTGLTLTPSSFLKLEDRDLARTHYQLFIQTALDIPIQSHLLRIWTDLKTGDVVQVEAHVESPEQSVNLPAFQSFKNKEIKNPQAASEQTMRLVRNRISKTDDPTIQSIKWVDQWYNRQLVRAVKAKGRRGTHKIQVALDSGILISYTYEEFPQSEFSVPAKVYPIYEEAEGTSKIQERVLSELKYLNSETLRLTEDPYGELRKRRYLETFLNPVLGNTPDGQSKGFWSMTWIKEQAALIRNTLSKSENSFKTSGVILDGRYATVSIHPDAVKKLSGISFSLGSSPQLFPMWQPTPEDSEVWEMIPQSARLGRPLTTIDDAISRVANRHPDHDPTTYINDGFDEVQVYYAITQLFDSLHAMGFTDPELSTRPFNAFLYDTDISMKDNAYYTDDTINFTTYSSGNSNYARDNPTIWHELGHGIMDRLMGDYLELADTGGLSEGMADFVADLVISDVSQGMPFDGSDQFRIINKTGFNLTNEVHDDGEAYGGVMHDLLVSSMEQKGRDGLVKVTDLTMETMRLTRNHPALTASEWFSHMLFADSLGADAVRDPGELSAIILKALNGRNFSFDDQNIAKLTILNDKSELTDHGPGSRRSPIRVDLGKEELSTYSLNIGVSDSPNPEGFHFKYPVQLKVSFEGGPLQGAVHWSNEEKGPVIFTLNSAEEKVDVNVSATGVCDFINREDGSCSDFVYLMIYNADDLKEPTAKKRFYVRVKPAMSK